MGESSLGERQTNCANCGAPLPLQGNKCAHCATPFSFAAYEKTKEGQPQTQAQPEQAEDLTDLETAFKAMAGMKRAKGDEEGAQRWESSSNALRSTVNAELSGKSAESNKICSRCGANNRSIANFCAQCGLRL